MAGGDDHRAQEPHLAMRNKICHKESPQWSASRREWSVNHIEREDSDKAGVLQGHPSPQIPLPATRIHRTTTDRAAISPKMRGISAPGARWAQQGSHAWLLRLTKRPGSPGSTSSVVAGSFVHSQRPGRDEHVVPEM